MKIPTNFTPPAQRMLMPIMAGMSLAILALLSGLIWLVADAGTLRSELPQLRQRLVQVHERAEQSARHTKPSGMTAPSRQELSGARQRIARINAAAQGRGLPTLALLAELERRLPDGARLTALHHRAVTGEVVLTAAAASADPLSAFLLSLERSNAFEEVMLTRESHPAQGRAGVQFEIRLKVRS